MRYFARESEIVRIATGKRVLHLGCVGFNDEEPADRIVHAQKSLHARLTAVASVVGIDHSAEIVEELARRGVFDNIVVADVEALTGVAIDGTFEVIVLGDIIEHVGNPGLVLEGLRRFCTEKSRLIVTVPNATGLPNYLRFVVGRYREGIEHVLSFNQFTLRHLLERYGYEIERMDTCHQEAGRSGDLSFRFFRAILGRFPKFGGTLFAVAIPSREGQTRQ